MKIYISRVGVLLHLSSFFIGGAMLLFKEDLCGSFVCLVIFFHVMLIEKIGKMYDFAFSDE